MKLVKSAVTLTAIILAMTSVTHAFLEEGTRGGGDNVALEFQQALISAIQESKSDPQLNKFFTENNIIGTASRAKIVVVDDALDIKVKDLIQNSVAVNIPAEQKILINRQRWTEVQERRIRNAIALHEVLSLKKIEQTGFYPYSSKYLALVGSSVNSFTTALEVNRLEQLRATSTDKKSGTVLRDYFNEAREPISIRDFPDEATKKLRVFRCLYTQLSSDTLFETNIIKVNAFLNSNVDSGPLFPDVKAWRLFVSTGDDPQNLETLKEWQESTWVAKPNEFIQTFPGWTSNKSGVTYTYEPYSLSFRKNNGLLTFKYESIGSGTTYWGYCFFKK